MDILISEQANSVRAHRASNGATSLSAGSLLDTTLEELVLWLKTVPGTPVTGTMGEEIVISHFNQVGVEIHRTTIWFDDSDRNEIFKALGLADHVSG
jgi:hypothetical protein